MEVIAATALMVAILYVLSRWALATVKFAAAHPGVGQPAISWSITWYLSLLVSLGAACSAHICLIAKEAASQEVYLFNGIVFGGFLVGFLITGHCDHKVRLGIRK